MGKKETPETLSQTGGDRLKSQTFLSENQEFVFGLVEEVRSALVSQGILRQSDELSGEPPAISFKNYFCGARSLML